MSDTGTLLLIVMNIIHTFSAICPPGQNPNLTDTAECIDCEVGYYSPVNASDQCIMCSNNYTTPSTGSTMDTDCKSNFTSLVFFLSK